MAKLDDYIAEIAAEFPNPIHNDGGVNREMTDEEKQAWYRFSAERRIEKEKELAAEKKKQETRKALLEKLGITEDEAKLLLS